MKQKEIVDSVFRITGSIDIKLSSSYGIPRHPHATMEKWYFSIVDVVAVLTDSTDPQTYWRVLKKRLMDEGDETVTNCNAFKMLASDGKMRQTDVADQVQLFRLIQSIPSPKAEPFKLRSGLALPPDSIRFSKASRKKTFATI